VEEDDEIIAVLLLLTMVISRAW